MERKLNEQFVESLMGYLKKNILGNIENDKNLQHIFTNEEPLQNDQREALENKYFMNTTSVFRYDSRLRKVFWDEFTRFVKQQKKICSNNLGLLTKRLLPKPGTTEFETEGQKNLFKFAYQVADAVENYKILQHIQNKEMNGEISKEKAQDLKGKLKESKLVLVNDKNGIEKVLEEDEIKRALANVAYQADVYAGLQTAGEGEEKAVYADELQGFATENEPAPQTTEGKITLDSLELEIYQKQAMQVEIMLEDSGMFVDEDLKADKTGMVSGYIIDQKTQEKVRVEVNLSKPNSKFRFVFEGKPGANKAEKSFMLDKNEIQKYFKSEKKSVREVSEIKEKENIQNPIKIPGLAPEEPKKKAEPPSEEAKTGLSAAGPMPAPLAKSDFRGRSSFGANAPMNILAAKEAYRLKRKKSYQQGTRTMQSQTAAAPAPQQAAAAPQPQQPAYTPPKGGVAFPVPQPKPEAPKKTFSPAKVTGYAVAAGLGGPIVFSLFT